MEDYGYIIENLTSICNEIRALGESVGRDITLVAVTKSGSDEELLALAAAGVTDIGENRPGELRRRGDLLRERGYAPSLHEIGNLQRNKVKLIIESVSLIHSLDNLRLAEEISRQAVACGRRVPVLIEVNSAREEQKDGVMPDMAEQLFEDIRSLPGIEVVGLMTMGPVCEDAEMLRPYFRATRELFDRMNEKYAFRDGGILSMGMSDSYRVAIEEGSTLVRIGRRFFEKNKS